jgi:serine/threonine-protein kinase RsbW
MSSANRADLGSVSLTVPGRPEYLRLIRLAAADSGARAELSIEDVEDLRIAVDELTYALIGDDETDETLTLHYTARAGTVEIEGTFAAAGAAVVVSDLSRAIIRAVVDEYDIAEDGGVRSFRLVKRSRS